ncbi:MAG: AAA family ATPase [Candidatus Altiarchaeota archaeon]|nr:AAA family ATPase [Candidatus Altiarchaeota archaeon]
MAVNRVKSGISGLDELIQGGFPEGSSVLVTGSPGTGKTIFGLQFLVEGAKNNEPGIYLTFEETKKKVLDQGEQFGWDLGKLEKEGKLIINSVSDADIGEILKNLSDETKKIKAKRLVIDSLSTLLESARRYTSKLQKEVHKLGKGEHGICLPEPMEKVTREDVFYIIREINKLELTTLMISEAPKEGDYLSRDTISEFVCDGVIELKAIGGIGKRTLTISKLRSTQHNITSLDMGITDKGIAIEAT